jgi:hypothetical protein
MPNPDDIFKSLTPEELAKVEPISKEAIREALEQGRKDAEAFREANPLTFRDTGMRYR